MNTLPQHCWIPTGSGVLSSRWLRPLCSDRPEHRRHVTDFTDAEPEGTRCPDCVAIEQAMS